MRNVAYFTMNRAHHPFAILSILFEKKNTGNHRPIHLKSSRDCSTANDLIHFDAIDSKINRLVMNLFWLGRFFKYLPLPRLELNDRKIAGICKCLRSDVLLVALAAQSGKFLRAPNTLSFINRWNTWTWTSSCRRTEFQPARLRPAIKATDRHHPLRFALARPFPLGRFRLLRPQATRRAIIHPVTIQQLDQLLCPGSTTYSHILIPLDAPRPVLHTISNICPSNFVSNLL